MAEQTLHEDFKEFSRLSNEAEVQNFVIVGYAVGVAAGIDGQTAQLISLEHLLDNKIPQSFVEAGFEPLFQEESHPQR